MGVRQESREVYHGLLLRPVSPGHLTPPSPTTLGYPIHYWCECHPLVSLLLSPSCPLLPSPCSFAFHFCTSFSPLPISPTFPPIHLNPLLHPLLSCIPLLLLLCALTPSSNTSKLSLFPLPSPSRCPHKTSPTSPTRPPISPACPTALHRHKFMPFLAEKMTLSVRAVTLWPSSQARTDFLDVVSPAAHLFILRNVVLVRCDC